MQNKNLKAKFAAGEGYNPWYNLALEEYLLDNLGENEIILYLWQNDNTVVIGRNQNAWQECRVGDLEENGGKLARRLSGGGAVFHDLGNLNYTLLMPRKKYNLKENLKVILKALQDLGVEAEFSGRNDIICDAKKISGNAYYLGSKAAYIHGTVLVNSDLEKLVSYLKVSDAKIKSKGIDSIKSRVMNLTEIDDKLTVAKIKESIKTNFAELYNQGQPLEEIKIKAAENDEFNKIYDKYSSWDWRFGKSPDFDISFKNRFQWGEVELNLKLSSATIKKAVLYSDAMYSDLIPKIAESLTNQPFELTKILKAAEKSLENYNWQNKNEGKNISEDFLNWLEKELKTIIY
jgi:lipoate-protein ligase A